ncbi:MAG: PQQ-binding-like beta-propeller repeat protein [Vicinamibacterales bacterium]
MHVGPPRVVRLLGAAVLVAHVATSGGGATSLQSTPRTLARAWLVGEPVVGNPVTDMESAYALTKRHEVISVEAASGRVRWRQPTNKSGFGGTGASVVLSGGVVVVGDYDVLGFDARTGAERWHFTPSEGYGPGFYLSHGATADGMVYAGSPSGRVYALEAATGRLRWMTAVATDGKTTVYPPQFDGPYVAAGYTEFVAPNRGGVVLLDARDGRIVWTRPFPPASDPTLSLNWAGGPVFGDGAVIVSSGDGVIHAFDLADGNERWRIPALSPQPGNPILPDRDFRGLAVVDDLLITGSLTGIVVAFDLSTRDIRWTYRPTRLGSVAFRLAASGDDVYVPFAGGTLVNLQGSDGVERWRVGDWTASMLWPPARWNDLIIVSGAVNGLSAFHVTEN